MVFGLFKRRPHEPPPPRELLRGAVRVGDREWQVREERRQGPFPQLFVFTATDAPASQLHLRASEHEPILDMDELEARAAEPTYRFFVDDAGARWEARLVLPDPPDRRLVKMICWDHGVHEAEWPFEAGLALPSDDELRELLAKLRAAG